VLRIIVGAQAAAEKVGEHGRRVGISMTQPSMAGASGRGMAAHRPALLGRLVLDWWRALMRDLFDTYRPELYYMRGPGPKWRAKHARGDAAANFATGFGQARR
jgi:hypothetical protein